MEGNLWKWTNYFSGWQPRWFVLENGILSYYRSKEDVINGCKGSIKMSVCDVHVHATDNTRLDLSIPSEAHFYVKVATPQERQEWLIALGSCKAAGQAQGSIHHHHSSSSTNSASEVPEEQLKSKKSELRLYCDLLMQQVHSVKTSVKDQETPDIEQLNEASSLLSATCDTFIHTLEECVHLVNTAPPAGALTLTSHSPSMREGVAPPTPTKASYRGLSPFKGYSGSAQRSISADGSGPHTSGDEDGIVRGVIPPKLRGSSSQSRTPTKNHRNSAESPTSSPHNSPSHSKSAMGLIVENGGDIAPSVVANGSHHKLTATKSQSLPVTPTSHSKSFQQTLEKQAETSNTKLTASSSGPKSLDSSNINTLHEHTTSHNNSYSSSNNPTTDEDEVFDEVQQQKQRLQDLMLDVSSDYNGGVGGGGGFGSLTRKTIYPEEGVRDNIHTFFSVMEVNFQDIKFFEDGGVPTTQFLSSCKEILPIFDKLNPTAFAPIKMEFTGNVRKIQQKYSTDPDHFITLQNIVLYEVKKRQHSNANSATAALLWLKRGLEFIREFLLEYMTGIQDLTKASNNAYCRSLKPFHSYVVRGVFALAAKSAPSREVFTQSLATNPFHTKRANFEQVLLRDIEAYVTANDVAVKILNDFFTEYNLHSDEQL